MVGTTDGTENIRFVEQCEDRFEEFVRQLAAPLGQVNSAFHAPRGCGIPARFRKEAEMRSSWENVASFSRKRANSSLFPQL